MRKTALRAAVSLLVLVPVLVVWAVGPLVLPVSVGAQQATPFLTFPLSEEAQLARQGFEQAHRLGCISCHSTTGQRVLGPSFLGFYGSVVVLQDGSIAWVNEEYLRQTISDPGTHAVAGFPGDVMPDYSAVIDEQELTALVAFLRSIGAAQYGVPQITPPIPSPTFPADVTAEAPTDASPTPGASPQVTPVTPGAAPPMAGLSAAARAGRLNIMRHDCVRCHSLDGTDSLGPTLVGLYGSEVTLDDGSTVQADEDYLRTAILDHDAQIVADYPAGLAPTYEGSLNQAQVNAIIAFLREFSEGAVRPGETPPAGTAAPSPAPTVEVTPTVTTRTSQ